ncbi:MAG: 4Fe-4S binding protein [Candidatus Methanospirareceae archaeon]
MGVDREEIDRRIGVYVCHCGVNIAATVDVERVTRYARLLPGVRVARNYQYMCSDPGQKLIKEDIKNFGLNRVVVASCSPRMHEVTFRKVLEEAGLNPYLLEMVNIREQCSWVHEDKERATEKAMDLIRGAVYRANLLKPLEKKEEEVVRSVLVIGGGVSGIYAALDIADRGFKVYLVEKSPSIGGHMAQLDKTFPTLDCAACILTPKMVDVSNHENIELMTYAEVEEVRGRMGDFKVKIRKRRRFVDENKCRGCIEKCASVCPIEVPNEFDAGIGMRKAIYIPFPQAVPPLATIDEKHCIGCRLCERACELGAIDYFQKVEDREINVGAIIVATGYDLFDPTKECEYGYRIYEEVITGLEFERLCNASGPTGGEIRIKGKKPRDVVFISCVGSRCAGSCERGGEKIGNPYCSRVCCMYVAKQAHLVKEKIPDARVTVFYTDVRAYGDGFEEFYMRVREEGVEYKRRELGDPIEVVRKGDRLEVRAWGEDYHHEVEADLVVLATGMVPNRSADKICRILKLSRGSDGFFSEAHPKLRPVESVSDGIFLAGCCQSPKDIPDSIAQALAASSKAAILLSKGKIEMEPVTAYLDANLCSLCKLCESVCPYDAISFDENKGRVDEVLCKGCGLCVSACPSGAISLHHFEDEQIEAQLRGIIA